MRALKWLGGIIAALLLLVAGLVWFADTDMGHGIVADRIAALSPKSGLRIHIGRIDGSIYGKVRLHDLQLSDPKGVFFDSGDVALDWTPLDWFSNKLTIASLTAPTATLRRLPKFTPSDSNGPILPDYDIHIGRLKIDRLVIGAPVTGTQRIGSVDGNAEIHARRALVKVDARVEGGDKVALDLDAEPDRDKFDLKADVDAPAGGVLGAMIGTARPVTLRIDGRGSWRDWHGNLAASASGAAVATLALTANDGRYGVDGIAYPSRITGGKLASLTTPQVAIRGTATLKDRQLDTNVFASSAAIAATAKGIVDLGANSFSGMKIDARLLAPTALFPNMTGSNIVVHLALDGPFATSGFDYLLTADRLAFDTTGLEQVRASGKGRLSAAPVVVPIALSAARITGVGNVAGGILSDLRVEGPLRVTPTLIMSDGLTFKSDKLSGKLNLLLDLQTGHYDVGVAGQLGAYLIPGLGMVEVKSNLQVVPGANGAGARVLGHGQAWVRRLDNAFLASLTGGLPMIETGLERDAEGVIHFMNARLTSPDLALTGNGYRRRDGSFHFEGVGTQRRYGPVRLVLDGPIERPKLDLHFARPMDGMKLKDVHAELAPTATGYDWKASGGSMLGAFTGNGAILLPQGGAAVIRIATIRASELTARGDLTSANGALNGQLVLSGGGVAGTLALRAERGIQRIDAHLTARDTKMVGPPLIIARRGQLDASLLLDPKGLSIDATVQGQGLRYGNIPLASLAANAKLVDGRGVVRASFAGSRGQGFEMQTLAQVTPQAISAIAQGTINSKPVKFDGPLVLSAVAGGWQVAPVSIHYDGGDARLSGAFGGGATALDAEVAHMPVSVLNLLWPNLGMGGLATGHVSFAQAAGATIPTGRTDLKIRNMTRAGLVLSSRPVDVGVSALLDNNGAAIRAIAVSNGATLGQAQARIAPIGPGANFADRLSRAPLFAQLRYNGASDTLWRLMGIEGLDVSGPVAIGADVGGSWSNPAIRGSLRTDSLRIESPVSGTVLTNVKAQGVFDGSTLVIDRFTGAAGKGSISGRARFDLAAANGFGMEIVAQAQGADLLRRDDLAATVTGPLAIRSDGGPGQISGNITVDRSTYRLGRANAASAVPRLAVHEHHRPVDAGNVRAAPREWNVDVKAHIPSRLMVTGLGLDSEWHGDIAIGGSLDGLTIGGQLEALRGGYEFAGKRFDLTRGAIRFTGDTLDPVLDMRADAKVGSLAAVVRVTGTALRPDIAFTSTPAMPQDELLSRLLFGTSITSLSAPEAIQLAAAVAALRDPSGGLNPINALRSAIGLDRLRILPADASTGARTALAAGKYLTRRTYLEIISDGQGYAATRIEFQITRWLSLLSTVSTIGRTSAAVRVSKDY